MTQSERLTRILLEEEQPVVALVEAMLPIIQISIREIRADNKVVAIRALDGLQEVCSSILRLARHG